MLFYIILYHIILYYNILYYIYDNNASKQLRSYWDAGYQCTAGGHKSSCNVVLAVQRGSEPGSLVKFLMFVASTFCLNTFGGLNLVKSQFALTATPKKLTFLLVRIHFFWTYPCFH
jgi:hypothetical protein